MITASILKAADQAARWHEEQRRKGSKGEPYVNHLLEVAALVAEADPDNTNAIIAALLHDAIEDQEIKREEIAEKFGDSVAVIVEECSDDKSLDKWVRKQLQIDTAAQKSPDAKLVKIADKISNLRSITASPPAHWPVERRRGYVEWCVKVVEAGLLGQSTWLDALFEETRQRAHQAVIEAAGLDWLAGIPMCGMVGMGMMLVGNPPVPRQRPRDISLDPRSLPRHGKFGIVRMIARAQSQPWVRACYSKGLGSRPLCLHKPDIG